jgi:predicted ABC-type sugar transport system permease subunit
MKRRPGVFDVIVLANALFVVVGAVVVHCVSGPDLLDDFLAGGVLGWLNNLVSRAFYRVVVSRPPLWKTSLVSFVFTIKLGLNFAAIYYLVVVLELRGLYVLFGLFPGLLGVLTGSFMDAAAQGRKESPAGEGSGEGSKDRAEEIDEP